MKHWLGAGLLVAMSLPLSASAARVVCEEAFTLAEATQALNEKLRGVTQETATAPTIHVTLGKRTASKFLDKQAPGAPNPSNPFETPAEKRKVYDELSIFAVCVTVN